MPLQFRQACAVRDIEQGRRQPCITAMQLLADVDVNTCGGGGSEYLADLRAKRSRVSELELLTTRPEYFMLNKVFADCHVCVHQYLK